MCQTTDLFPDRRAVLASLAGAAAAGSALATANRTDARPSMTKTERLHALDVEFAAAFKLANSVLSAADASAAIEALDHLDKKFARAAEELWAVEPQGLDDFIARSICVSHYERDTRGALSSLFRSRELRRAQSELARAVRNHLADCWMPERTGFSRRHGQRATG